MAVIYSPRTGRVAEFADSTARALVTQSGWLPLDDEPEPQTCGARTAKGTPCTQTVPCRYHDPAPDPDRL